MTGNGSLLETRLPGTGQQLLVWAAAKLAVDFAASFPDEATTRARQHSWREMIEAHPWITPRVFERAVYKIRWEHRGAFVPEPALFVDFCQAAADDLERERREAAVKLAPPPPPTDDERKQALDRVEAAKAAAWASLPKHLRGRYTPPGRRQE